jgi:hypothetical protein
MKFIRIGFVAVLLLLLIVPVGWAKGDKVLEPPPDGCTVSVEPSGPVYNEDGTVTWSYIVTEPGGKCKDLSDWAIVLPEGANVLGGTPGYEVGVNPHTGDYSIKWDVTDGFESGIFSFTLEDSYGTGSVEYAAKAGRTLDEYWTDGPVVGSSQQNDPSGGE